MDRYDVPKDGRKVLILTADVERGCAICDRARESSGDRGLYRISVSDGEALFIGVLNWYDDIKKRCVGTYGRSLLDGGPCNEH